MGRFSWLQHDLGVNRGQYMGLLPCLLRSAVSFLSAPLQHHQETKLTTSLPLSPSSASLNSSFSFCSSTPITTTNQSQSNLEEIISDRLQWTESIFTLTLALISVSNALTALTENGFISLLLSIIKLTPEKSRSSLQVYVEVLVVQIMDMSLTGHPLALSVFEDLSGIDTILERLIKELTLLSILQPPPSTSSSSSLTTTKTTLTTTNSLDSLNETTEDMMPSTKRRRKEENLINIFSETKSNLIISEGVVDSSMKIYINSLLGIFSLYLHETHGHQGQFLRSQNFSSLFSILFKNASTLSISILTSAIALFSEVINNDPAILSHMISNGLVESAILSMIENSKVTIFLLLLIFLTYLDSNLF